MSTVASYYLYQKYEKRGNQPWLPSYPNVWSIDGDGTMPVVKKMDADPDCPIYRWTPTEDTICIEGQYRTTTSDTFYCSGESGYDKYVDVYTEYSEDGIHWATIETAATLVEEESEDCGFVPYQKRYLTFIPLDDTTFTCSVPSELTANTFEYSVDSGQTWTQWRVTTPTTTIRAGQKMYIRGGGGNDSSVYGIMGAVHSDGRFNVEGNIMSLLGTTPENFSGMTDFDFYGIQNGVFQRMFSESRVVNAENLILQATNLTKSTQFVSNGGIRCYRGMFEGCGELVKAPRELPALELTHQCYALMFANCTSLTSIPNELPATAITEGSYDRMFQGCTAITESPIIRVERFTSQTYDFYSCGEMFSGCTSLTGITCYIEEPKWHETYNWVKDVAPQGVFRQPSSATTKWGVGDSGIPNGWVVEDIDTHTQYRWTESGTTCNGYNKYKNNIKEQSIDSGQTWTVVIPEVYSASTLIEANSPDCGYVPPSPKFILTLNNATTVSGICGSNAISSGETKAYRTSTVSAVIYNCISAISGKTFENFYYLTSVTIPNTVTIIGTYAFRYCYALASLTIPSSVKKINDGVFNYCSGITGLTIDTGLEDIGASAFANCSGLTSVTLPSSVTKIAGSAFRYCTNLQSITCLAETPPFLAGYYSFYDTNDCVIYVPAASVNTYKSEWSSYNNNYADRIQAIP